MFLVYLGSTSPPSTLASKHATVGFSRVCLFLSGAVLFCFEMRVENRKSILE